MTCQDVLDKVKTILELAKGKVDEIEFSGPPDRVEIKALSASLTSSIRDTKRTQAWERYSLQGIAAECNNNLFCHFVISFILVDYKSSLLTGQDMHLGPPLPLDNSADGIDRTLMPFLSKRSLVT